MLYFIIFKDDLKISYIKITFTNIPFQFLLQQKILENIIKTENIYSVSRWNMPYFGRLFLKLKYADLTKTPISEFELLRR